MAKLIPATGERIARKARPKTTTNAVAARRALLAWFRHNARDLPWRKTHSPYAIWISEVMLQQTQVATVTPYYLRFLHRFPTVKHLAAAPLERVLELWSGLGYYRRARNLHSAARVVASQFGGRFPRDYRQARSLPGIGDYTARAILSITFNQAYTLLEGNVARVVARLAALKGHINQPEFRRAVEEELDRLLSRRQPGNFNQALMELGQTVCLPRAPRCPACPLHKWCAAFRHGEPEIYPEPRPRRATELRHLATGIIRRGSKVAVVRGLDEGLLADLWNFPAAFGSTRALALRSLREKLSGQVGGVLEFCAPLAELRHNITHRSIRVHIFSVRVHGRLSTGSFRWLSAQNLERAAISQLARKISARIADNGQRSMFAARPVFQLPIAKNLHYNGG